jgi:hypothetical protein
MSDAKSLVSLVWDESGKRGSLQAALTHLLDRFYVVCPNGQSIRAMSTDELERREQTARVSWGVEWPNVRAVIDARKALEEAAAGQHKSPAEGQS